MDLKTLQYLLCALVAFAANSVLCRIALGEGYIDANAFTAIRLVSGALTLALVFFLGTKNQARTKQARGSWLGGVALFLYAICFSYAYITLDTGTGALILFGTVQVTMILISVYKGNRLKSLEVIGVLLAFLGIFYLMLPSLSTPSLFGFLLMMIAGVAWGIYSIIGQGSESPLADTTFNFIRTLPLVVILTVVVFIFDNNAEHVSISHKGALYAALSGALASGLGYAVWYKVLPKLNGTLAAVSQLLVPIIAAFGGLVFLSEVLTMRLFVSSVLVLGGICLVIYTRHQIKG